MHGFLCYESCNACDCFSVLRLHICRFLYLTSKTIFLVCVAYKLLKAYKKTYDDT